VPTALSNKGNREISVTLKTLLKASSAIVLLSAIAANAQATHPATGEALAEVQTFTYRVLDEHSSVDPQVVEDVTGAEVVRDLFEGLMNQDATGIVNRPAFTGG
jgi:oligopeptide transport system substrate-binding protein